MNSLIVSLVKNSIVGAFACLLISCQGPQTVTDSVGSNTSKIIQGVTGKVLFKEGNFTTSGEIIDQGKIYGVERRILFYELTNIKNAEIGDGDFVKNISSELIDSTYSDKNGNFSKELPEGKYSVFVQESKRLYSKLGDYEYFQPLVISYGKNERLILEIDYKANYK